MLFKFCVIPLGEITNSEQFELDPGHSDAAFISWAIASSKVLVMGTSERAQPSSMGRRSSRKKMLTNLIEQIEVNICYQHLEDIRSGTKEGEKDENDQTYSFGAIPVVALPMTAK